MTRTKWPRPENDQYVEEIYLDGEWVERGNYRQVGSSRLVCLDRADFLPPGLDGRAACYVRCRPKDKHPQQTISPVEGTFRI